MEPVESIELKRYNIYEELFNLYLEFKKSNQNIEALQCLAYLIEKLNKDHWDGIISIPVYNK